MGFKYYKQIIWAFTNGYTTNIYIYILNIKNSGKPETVHRY